MRLLKRVLLAACISATGLLLSACGGSDPELKVKVATLAPAGTNHDLNAQRWIDYKKIPNAEIAYFDDFLVAGDQLVKGNVDYIVITPVHLQFKELTTKYENQIFLIDCFKGKTYEMALLTYANIAAPKSVAFYPVTTVYFDVTKFPVQIKTNSNIESANRLLAGEVDSAFTFTSYAKDNPGKFRIDKLIGESLLQWNVYSNKRPATTDIVCRS